MTDSAITASPAPGILLVTRNLPPLLGGMERLNLHLAIELGREFKVMVVGPKGSAASLPGVPIREVPHKPLWRFLVVASLRAAELARQYRPGCVIAGSGLTAPMAFLAARLSGASSAVYVHGLDLVASHSVHRWIWQPLLRRMDLCIANSSNTANLARSIGIPAERISVLHPGVELPDPDSASSAAEFRQQHGLTSCKILLAVGRMMPRKGLVEFVDEALPSVTESYPDATLVIIGDEAPDALVGAAAGMGERIMERARSKGLERNVLLLGRCEESVLSAAYGAADALVFPVRETPGDVEGFGMVAIEAASHGLPTVAFSVGGISDAVSDGRSGWLVEPADYRSFAERVTQVLGTGRTSEVQHRCRVFAERLAWPRFGALLRELINRLFKRRSPL